MRNADRSAIGLLNSPEALKAPNTLKKLMLVGIPLHGKVRFAQSPFVRCRGLTPRPSFSRSSPNFNL